MNLIPYKQWATEEAMRSHVHITSIYHRVANGEYPELKMERKNKRVINVPPYPVARIVMANADGRTKYDFSKVDWSKETNLSALARRMGCHCGTARYAKRKAI